MDIIFPQNYEKILRNSQLPNVEQKIKKVSYLLTAVVILKGAGAALRGMQRTMNDILQIVGGKLGGVLNIIST